jgi:predicted nucleic acid-binding protein
LDFIEDPDDRVIIRDALAEGADILLTSDNDILQHKVKLSKMNIRVMRPKEWLDQWLAHVKGSEDSAEWLERGLFTVGRGV